MGVNTKVEEGIVNYIPVDVTIDNIEAKGSVNYNPSFATDDKSQTWISIRSCETNIELFEGYKHPMGYQNFLYIAKFDPETFKITDVKEVVPEEDYPGFQWGIEDVRLFWREDGLHGIGVILPITPHGPRANQAEILIDYTKGTYKLVKDYKNPMGTPEKNWMPPAKPARLFDFAYSPTQIVLDGQVIGEPNDLFLHNGTPLLEYEDGFISIMHIVCAVKRERTYVSLAAKWDKSGHVTHISQFFHFNVGWREKLKETIEFVSGLMWHKDKLVVGIGVKDELLGFCTMDPSVFTWKPYVDTAYYNWKWLTPPNRHEIEY